MKLCSSDSSCGNSGPKRTMPELILEKSKENENIHNEEIVKEIISNLNKKGINLTLYTKYVYTKHKNSINLTLMTSNNKKISIFYCRNQSDDLTNDQINNIKEKIEKNIR